MPTKQPKRFRFVTDESCHWYCIPSEKESAFSRFVQSEGEIGDFDKYRLNMHVSRYTFSDINEDK